MARSLETGTGGTSPSSVASQRALHLPCMQICKVFCCLTGVISERLSHLFKAVQQGRERCKVLSVCPFLPTATSQTLSDTVQGS